MSAVGNDPEWNLVLSYAAADRRAALATLFLLDRRFGDILRDTRDPMVGQMRLTWWFDALERLDQSPAPAEPVLQALAASVLPLGVSGAMLATMIDGWEDLLESDGINTEVLQRHAAGRGEGLFAIAAQVLGAAVGDPVAAAGRGWALVDLARHLRDTDAAAEALGLAATSLAEATSTRWSRNGRALGALAHIARLNAAVALDRSLPVGAPQRVARLMLHRLTGR